MGVPRTIEGIPIVQLLSAELPEGSLMTPVGVVVAQELASKATVDNIYTITNGKTLKLRRLMASADDLLSSVELHYRTAPEIVLSSTTLLAKIFVGGSTAEFDLDETYGSGQIVMRLVQIAGGRTNVFARWKGHEL